MHMCQKMQKKKKKRRGALEPRFKSESILTDYHIKMPTFTAEIIMFTAWYKNSFVLHRSFVHSCSCTRCEFAYDSTV